MSARRKSGGRRVRLVHGHRVNLSRRQAARLQAMIDHDDATRCEGTHERRGSFGNYPICPYWARVRNQEGRAHERRGAIPAELVIRPRRSR